MLGVISWIRLTSDRARQGTYSIVARDPRTGELGVAVQSHWFSVGPIVPWARVGIGAVATQANAEISYGPRLADVADELTGLGRHAEAAEVFQQASGLAPDNHELLFWGGLGAAHGGELDLGVSLVRRAIELQPGWAELLPRLPADVARSAATVRARLRERQG